MKFCIYFVENDQNAGEAMDDSELETALAGVQCKEEHYNQLSFLKCSICNKSNCDEWEEY